MVSDHPVLRPDQDRLDFAPYAAVFTAFFLDQGTPTPMSLAISGPWGSGKTSLARLIDARLHTRQAWRDVSGWYEKPLTCWFNAWHHADAPKVGLALASNVARTIAPKRRIWWRVIQPLPTSMLTPGRRWWRRLWQGFVGVLLGGAGLFTLVWLFPALRPSLGPVGELVSKGPNPVLLFGAAVGLIALATRAFKMGSTLGTYIEEPQAVAATGAVADVREHLGRLVRQALRQPHTSQLTSDDVVGNRRLVVFVDDLERCDADQALGVCEVVSQLLDHPGVIVVLVSDLAPLVGAAAKRYEGEDADVLGERYLDKLIAMRFNLPPLRAESVQKLFDNTNAI